MAQKGEGRVVDKSAAESEMYLWGLVLRGQAFGTGEFSSSMIGRATEQAVKDVVRRLNELSSEVKGISGANAAEAVFRQLGQAEGKVLGQAGSG